MNQEWRTLNKDGRKSNSSRGECGGGWSLESSWKACELRESSLPRPSWPSYNFQAHASLALPLLVLCVLSSEKHGDWMMSLLRLWHNCHEEEETGSKKTKRKKKHGFFPACFSHVEAAAMSGRSPRAEHCCGSEFSWTKPVKASLCQTTKASHLELAATWWTTAAAAAAP